MYDFHDSDDDDGDVEMIVWEQTVGAKLVLLPPHSYSGATILAILIS